MQRAIRAVALGQACVDYLGSLSAFPAEDGKVELSALHVQCGGPASSALVALSRLGIMSAFLGAVGSDSLGRRIVENLKREGIQTLGVKVRKGHSSQFSFIAVNQGSGKRTIFWHRGTAPHLEPAEVDLAPYSPAEVLHLDGLMIRASIEAARQAHARGMLVVLDGGTLRDGTPELLEHVDVLIASETFAAPLLGPGHDPLEALRVLSRMGPKEVVITLGERGSVGCVQRQEVIHRQEAYRVPVVDTTGAGDVFHGGYLFALLQGWSMPQCMRFAAAVAALKCMRRGAQAGAPDLQQVEKFLKDQPATCKSS